MHSAVHKAIFECAVFSRVALEALTLSVHAAASVLAVIGTLGLGAVGSLPARLTSAATSFSAVVSMTIAVRLSSHLTFDR